MTGIAPAALAVSVDGIGAVYIGAPLGRPPRAAALLVEGGLLTVDPFAPDRPPHTVIDPLVDEDDLGWVALVYGWAVAAAVRTARAAERPARDKLSLVATAEWEPGHLHVPTARLALIGWLAAWAPTPYNETLLAAEMAHLSLLCEDLLPAGDDTAQRLFIGTAGYLAELAERLFDRDSASIEPAPAREAREILRSALAVLDRDHPDTDRLLAHADALAELAAEDERARPEWTPAPAPVLRQVDDGSARDWSRSTVDSIAVPPRAVREIEDNIAWRFVDGVVEIEVLAGPRAVAVDTLVAEIRSSHVLVATGPLALAAPDVWIGRIPLGDRSADIDVQVHHPDFEPREASVPELARVERAAVRSLAELRCDLVCAEVLPVRQALGRLRDEADELADVAPEDPLVPRLAALAVGIEDRLAGRAGVIDLDHPSWAPNLAEWAHLRRRLLG